METTSSSGGNRLSPRFVESATSSYTSLAARSNRGSDSQIEDTERPSRSVTWGEKIVNAGVASAWIDSLRAESHDTGSFQVGTIEHSLAFSSLATSQFSKSEAQPMGPRGSDGQLPIMDMSSMMASETEEMDPEMLRQMIRDKMNGDPLLCIPVVHDEEGTTFVGDTQIEAMMKFYGLSESKVDKKKRRKRMKLEDIAKKYRVKNKEKDKKKKKRNRRGVAGAGEDSDDEDDTIFAGGDVVLEGSNTEAGSTANAGKGEVDVKMQGEDGDLVPDMIVLPDPRAVLEFVWCVFRQNAVDLNQAQPFRLFAAMVYLGNAVSLAIQSSMDAALLAEVTYADVLFLTVIVSIYLVRFFGRTNKLMHTKALLVDSLVVGPALLSVIIALASGETKRSSLFPLTIFLIWHVFETRRLHVHVAVAQLRIYMKTFTHGVNLFLWVSILLFAMIYSFGVLVRVLLAGEDVSDIPAFASLPESIISLLNIAAGQGWAVEQVRVLRSKDRFIGATLVVYLSVYIVRLLFMTFVVGASVDLAMSAGFADRFQVEQEQLLKSLKLPLLKKELEAIDVDGNGYLTWVEMQYGLVKPDLRAHLGIHTLEEAMALFTELDSDGIGEIPLEAVVYSHIKRSGASLSVDAVCMEHQLRTMRAAVATPTSLIGKVGTKLKALERKMHRQTKAVRSLHMILQIQIRKFEARMSRIEAKVHDMQRMMMTPDELSQAGQSPHAGTMVVAGWRLKAEMDQLKAAVVHHHYLGGGGEGGATDSDGEEMEMV